MLRHLESQLIKGWTATGVIRAWLQSVKAVVHESTYMQQEASCAKGACFKAAPVILPEQGLNALCNKLFPSLKIAPVVFEGGWVRRLLQRVPVSSSLHDRAVPVKASVCIKQKAALKGTALLCSSKEENRVSLLLLHYLFLDRETFQRLKGLDQAGFLRRTPPAADITSDNS